MLFYMPFIVKNILKIKKILYGSTNQIINKNKKKIL